MTARLTILLVVLIALAAGISPVSHAQDVTPDRLADLLIFAPDTPDTRAWLTYGDIAGWHISWGVPRPLNQTMFEALPRIPRAYWMALMPRQTMPSQALGLEYLLTDDARAFYGFDFFQVDRALAAGNPPDAITVIEHNADPEVVAEQLIESGYTASDPGNGWALYSIFDDYEVALGAESGVEVPRIGMLGQRNRIALYEQRMIIARATGIIEQALAAAAGDIPALIDDPAYAALASALHDPLLDGTGDLLGVIMQQGLEYVGDPVALYFGPSTTPENMEALREQYGLDDPANLLPPFNAVAFATFHGDDATYLTLALAFPPGTDTGPAISVLEAKLPTYQSLVTDRSFADRWTLDRSGAVEVDGVPVALVVMRVQDPTPPPENPADLGAAVLSWYDMVVQRDVAFLATVTAAGAE